MQIRVIGSNIEVGGSLTSFASEHLEKVINKYFDHAVSSEVHISKDSQTFKTLVTVNEGVKGGIVIKSNAEAGDVYASFLEACDKISKQLGRYKERIKNYRRQGGGLKSVEPNYQAFEAMKYVLLPEKYDVFGEMENEENAKKDLKIIAEKNTEIEELSVDQAIMKMDLADLPALVFLNEKTKKINVVYHRKDGNISWIEPQI